MMMTVLGRKAAANTVLAGESKYHSGKWGRNNRNLNATCVKLTEAVSAISRIFGSFTISCLSISPVAVKLVSNSGKNRQQSENLRTICHQKWYTASMFFSLLFI